MPQKVAPKKRAQAKQDNTTLIIAVGIVAVLVVALLVLLNINIGGDGRPPTPANATGRVWGKAEAPVTIDEYSDFQ